MESKRKQREDYQNKIIKLLDAEPDRPRSPFTPFEDEMLRKHYPRLGSHRLGEILGKEPGKIRHRAEYLGIRRRT